MANTYKVIDEKTWERAMHCMVFRNSGDGNISGIILSPKAETPQKKAFSMPKNIRKIVEDNVNYQRQCGLKTIVAPNIFFDSFDSRMSQIALSLANETIEYCEQDELLISICVNEVAFKNFDDVKDFLDIISLFNVDGFYIIIERNLSKNPNMIESDTMANILYFLYNTTLQLFQKRITYRITFVL